MAKDKAQAFDPSAVSVFVAPDAPRAVIVRDTMEGDYVFLLNNVPVDYIDLPIGYVDTEEEVAEAREALDALTALKANIGADQRDDLMFLIDMLAADVHYAEAALSEDKAAALAFRPRDPQTGRFIALS